ncbi:DUF6153 family protein [Jiangella sp. DSM 45060]|uniref:DUF6153 family protein n=1 Tax=Jiangella sp. DSM 45060 TaxID=1798224 RepID=UPI00087ACEDF|nr:DUF6153 family protein [Jiangella sp. DSM 45060]SDS77468.1 hypothetical protein SAMN04515669_1888 [Jiangella sp. DSM 45060]
MRTRRRTPRQLALRLLLVAVLALGLVAMHHLAGAGDGRAEAQVTAVDAAAPAGHAAPSDHGAASGDDGAGHGLFHLCLAVLTAAALMLAGWLLLGPRRWTSLLRPGALLTPPAPARPPPRPHGSALLVSLCVLRT